MTLWPQRSAYSKDRDNKEGRGLLEVTRLLTMPMHVNLWLLLLLGRDRKVDGHLIATGHHDRERCKTCIFFWLSDTVDCFFLSIR